MLDRLKRNSRDFLHLFLVPLLIALLPWKVGFSFLKWLARRGYGDGAGVERAWQAAEPHLPDQQADEWKRRFRLLQLVERVDAWLVLLRTTRWWSRQIDRSGSWPEHTGPFVILTFHWGGGQWIWRQLARAGISAHFLARRAQVNDIGAGRLALWYGRVRELGITRHPGSTVIITGGSSSAIRAALRNRHSVVGMLDLPASATQAVLRRPLLDGEVALPYGLLRVAADVGVDVLIVSCAIDYDTGRRLLHVIPVPGPIDVDEVASRYVEHLDRCLRREPAYWQLWSSAASMFVEPDPPSSRPE